MNIKNLGVRLYKIPLSIGILKFGKKNLPVYFLIFLLITFSFKLIAQNDLSEKVNPFIGTGGNGRIAPVASVPFGMVQLGPDTRTNNSGYHYDDKEILGFSHIHKSGGGCNDFLDILFQPIPEHWGVNGQENFPESGFSSRFSHKNESAVPGNYQVLLDDSQIEVSLTATQRCGFHRYVFPQSGNNHVVIDLKHGSDAACTIVSEEDYDTVMVSGIRVIGDRAIEGHRISTGWAPEQHVYFYAEFSKPFKSVRLFDHRKIEKEAKELKGTDIRSILTFDMDGEQELLVKTGISPVSAEGAKLNLQTEIPGWDFNKVKNHAREKWNRELAKIQIGDPDNKQKEIFYSSLYFTMMYPMLYSDVDGKYRGPDHKVHKTGGFDYYGAVVGFWDTFRAACPWLTICRPDVANDYVKTCLAHFNHFGLMPIWTLAGNETFQMLGYHAMPFIADCYYKGIRDYDSKAVFEAMKQSARCDTFGYSMKYFVGVKNYKKYGYIPADLEMEAVARTLEYSYDDWCIAQMAKMMGAEKDYNDFMKRAGYYRNVFDSETQLMRGRFSDGSWRTPFNPFHSKHRQDDYCEGNAWQWTFFVPHDVKGLAKLMGGKKELISRLDSLFSMHSKIHGEDVSGDISGLIGQYAHGNEPGHHTPYMYNYVGQPWKTQEVVNKVMYTLYDNTPDGICGNEDTGQMSAWYVWSAFGFYPVTHGTGEYIIGTPLFKDISLKHSKGVLKIKAPKVSPENKYIQSIKVNGKEYSKNYFKHEKIFGEDVVIEFQMGPNPNKKWGVGRKNIPFSMTN